MTLSLIVAKDKNGLIGRDNGIPWSLPNDLKYFRNTTLGHTVVMGRKTFESLGKPLPKRENVILTNNPHYRAEGCVVLHSVEEVLNYVKGKDAFIIGGSQIYELFFPYVEKLYITEVQGEFQGDAYFPCKIDSSWELVSKESHEPDEKHAVGYSFTVYTKRE